MRRGTRGEGWGGLEWKLKEDGASAGPEKNTTAAGSGMFLGRGSCLAIFFSGAWRLKMEGAFCAEAESSDRAVATRDWMRALEAQTTTGLRTRNSAMSQPNRPLGKFRLL